MLLRKLLCFFLGHKSPIDGLPAMQFSSDQIDGFHYVWQVYPCERCGGYSKVVKIDPNELEDTIQNMMNVLQDKYNLPDPGETIH